MLKNYIKIALRNIVRHKGYSVINIAGLAVGMACCILILLWVQHELSYDRLHENADQLYRIYYTNENYEGHAIYLPGTLAAYLKDNYPGIIKATSYKHWQKKISVGENSYLSAGSYVDPEFFEMFTFPFVKGDPKKAFNDPNSIVITEDLASKLFGNDDPLGQTVSYYAFSEGVDLKVTGVMKNIPHNSHIQFDFLIPYEIGYDWMKTWENNAVYTYVMLHKNSSYQEVNNKISDVLKIYRPARQDVLHLQPLKKIHLYFPGGGGQITHVYIFSTMALIVLLIACINFMNLSTARSEKRFKEIGIRKVVGSSRLQLINQFLSESILLSFLALILALFLTELMLPSINSILGSQLNLRFSGVFILALIVIALITGMFAGSYPAFFLSSFHPVAVLKGQSSWMLFLKRKTGRKLLGRSKAFSFRKLLVITQFSLSIFFIVCTLFIYKQLDYIKNRNLGFKKEHIIVLQSMGELKQKIPAVKNELLKIPEIKNVTFSAFSPVEWESSMSTIEMNWTGRATDQDFIIGDNYVDFDFLKAFGMEMAQGRFFSREFPTDASDACVVNEAAVKAMDLKDPIGVKITWRLGSSLENTSTIVGVIKDFHTQSLHHEIKPFVLSPIERIIKYMANYIYIRIKSNNVPKTLQLIESKIKEFVPNDPFVYRFFDEEVNILYKAEQLTGHLVRYGTFLVIFISCLGLFGLASFTTEQRTKEIGIRKVLGATASDILLLLNKDFIKWVLIANIIAWPVAYYAMHRWLQNFAYRANIGIATFILSATLALFIALITVSYHALKAAYANPIEALRYE
jgi:putative ABC transport system permease protein